MTLGRLASAPLALRFLALSLGLAVALLPPAARAAANGIFTVTNVPVDATAASATAAKTKALAAGTESAYQTLLHRLTPQNEWGRLPPAAQGELDNLVLGLEIDDEHSSTTRYLARLTVAFRADQVTGLLARNNLVYSVTRAAPALVLPVYKAGGKPDLWGDDNPWRQAWARLDFSQGLRPLVSPLGDLEDMNAASVEDALDGNTDKLMALARRYGAGEVLVAVATPSASALNVSIASYGGSSAAPALVQSFPGSGPSVMSNAASLIAAQLADAWKTRTAVTGGPSASLAVRIPLSGLEDWLAVRRRLAGTPMVHAVTLTGLSLDEADATLGYQGTVSGLALALAQSGLTLAPADPADPAAPRRLSLGAAPASVPAASPASAQSP